MALRSLNNPLASFIDYLAKTGTDAANPVPPPSGLTATGGVISDYTDPGSGNIYRAHIFTSSGTFSISALGTYGSGVECLVVAGGGGGYSQGGGGETGSGDYGSGAGGSGYTNPTYISSPILTQATSYLAANNPSPDRQNAGNGSSSSPANGQPGRFLIRKI